MNGMKIEQKALVVTGAGNGLGREITLQALQRGARVAAVDLRADSLRTLVNLANVGPRLSTHTADVTERDRLRLLVDEVVSHHGCVDGLVNNAGIIQPFVRIADLDHETMDRILAVNLHGILNAVKAFLPSLLERPEAHIANVSSMGAFLPVPGQSIYCASKAAVKLMSEGLYAELLDTSVGVSVIMPGAIDTGIMVNSGVDMPSTADADAHRPSSPSAVARLVLDGIEQGRLHVLPGRDSRLAYLASRLVPKAALHAVQKRMKDLLSPLGALPSPDKPARPSRSVG